MLLPKIVLLACFGIALNEGEEREYPGYDGWFNNRAHPEWGVVDMPLTRRLPSHYQDGAYRPSGWDRPNPREISEQLMKGDTGRNSYRNKTALLVFFGQQVVEEILDAQRPGCPPEYLNIPIPINDSLYDKEGTGTVEIPFLRSRYNQAITGFSPNFPRQQLNEITPFLDGGLTYGVNKAWADALRLHKTTCPERTADSHLFSGEGDPTDCRGELISVDDEGKYPEKNTIGLPLANPPPPRDHVLKDSRRFYKLGNPRGNENPFLLTFGVMWFRNHNWLARLVRKNHPEYSDEKVFNEARILNIAIHQKIVMYDWLPIFLGNCNENDAQCEEVSNYTGYKPSIHPGITHAFQSAAMRFGHTLVPPGVFRRSPYKPTNLCEFLNTTMFTAGDKHSFREVHVNKPALRTCNTYWNSIEAVTESDIHPLLLGMASQICEREDNIITPDLRGSVFGPLEFSRRDLMAINIQRGRDHGLPDYNTARESLGLGRRTSFRDVNPELFSDTDRDGPALLERFREVHKGNLENIDIWTGGLLETQKTGPGQLFRTIILDQFTRIRDSDRFWFENERNGLFNDEMREFIWNTTIKDVILRTNPSLVEEDIQDNPFIWDENDPNARCPQPFPLSEVNMEECTEPEHFDYFSGSEVSYALSFAAFGLYAILNLLLLLFLGKRRDRLRRGMRKRVVKRVMSSGGNDDPTVTFVHEVLGKTTRQIQVKLGPGRSIQVKSVHGGRLRTIDLGDSKTVGIKKSYNGDCNVLNIRADLDTYDLILRFEDSEETDQFYDKLVSFLRGQQINPLTEVLKETDLLATAQTKDKRDKLLQSFFRDAIESLQPRANGQRRPLNSGKSRKYINVELSKNEFAEYLKMKPDSLFVEQMFHIADTNNNGFISFREFLDIFVLFSKGTAEEKARLMFQMYDLDNSGSLSREEFRIMLKTMMDMVSSDIEASAVNDVVENMMLQSGFGDKENLTLDDFQQIMKKYSKELNDASLNISGTPGAAPQRGKTIIHAPAVRETKIHRARQTVKHYEQSMDYCEIGSMTSLEDIGGDELQKHNSSPSIGHKKDANGNKKLHFRFRKKSSAPHVTPQLGRIPTVHISVHEKVESLSKIGRAWTTLQKNIQNYRMHIFWLTMYTIVACAIFAERVYYFSIEREHRGLRRICGYGVSVTRGAASGMMFTYSSLLVTMSRNTITLLRETFLHRYIPFDSAVSMHRFIAWFALLFTAIHIIGHSINFYSISTQPASDLACLFSDYWRTSDQLPKFHYWCWQTVTGIGGVVCTLIVVTMYVFASDYARQKLFRLFWFTHNFGYVLLYLFMIIHGSGFLVQRPFFYYFFLGPAVLYTLDKLYSISRNKAEISVVKAELLPSEVTYLEFKRPMAFDYKAGQWVRIACLAQSPNEYHPFTLTSCPREDTLKLHIRAVGPWTTNLRNIYNPDVLRDSPYPKIFLDGPFGEGHQDWYKYEVSILVGGGIGVTPFASILKDLTHRAASTSKMQCKKVFFLWVTKDQKQYEWLTDIIQQVEATDENGFVDTHIFITQFPAKFDFRTTMLYICERQFQKIAGKSLFTGMRAITHFGRPDFISFFHSLAEEYGEVKEFGVFSCGPPPMTHAVDGACTNMNKFEGPAFLHHFENF